VVVVGAEDVGHDPAGEVELPGIVDRGRVLGWCSVSTSTPCAIATPSQTATGAGPMASAVAAKKDRPVAWNSTVSGMLLRVPPGCSPR
jgi:hypothetical protein